MYVVAQRRTRSAVQSLNSGNLVAQGHGCRSLIEQLLYMGSAGVQPDCRYIPNTVARP
jgi:hypothetical protein